MLSRGESVVLECGMQNIGLGMKKPVPAYCHFEKWIQWCFCAVLWNLRFGVFVLDFTALKRVGFLITIMMWFGISRGVPDLLLCCVLRSVFYILLLQPSRHILHRPFCHRFALHILLQLRVRQRRQQPELGVHGRERGHPGV